MGFHVNESQFDAWLTEQKKHIDPNASGGKEHIGYIVDRTGFEEYKRWALKDVVLPEKAEVMSPMYWKGIKY